MSIGYFLAPYVRRTHPLRAIRYVVVNDLTAAIVADGGAWREVEVLGNQAIVKVRASDATLTQIGALAGVTRVPLSRLDDSLSTLTAGQRTALRNLLLSAGYTASEVNTRFPDLSVVTIGDVLRFFATRRIRPRYNSGTDTIVLDGAVDACGSVDALDLAVQ